VSNGPLTVSWRLRACVNQRISIQCIFNILRLTSSLPFAIWTGVLSPFLQNPVFVVFDSGNHSLASVEFYSTVCDNVSAVKLRFDIAQDI